jgi:7,8-dihydropterin-6-yl-methyl-4-(beta-D-ribofuranosyl)aminobenzene 5'-phosphate synthase
MNRVVALAAYAVIFSLIWPSACKTTKETDKIKMESSQGKTTLSTIYDNYAHDPELKTGWGFSCFVNVQGKNILFDTGADSPTLLRNMDKLGIDPKTIGSIVLSHNHGDHTGGLDGLLEINSNLDLYLLRSFPDEFKNKVKSYQANVIEVSDPAKISESVSTTGELGTLIKEQALVVKTERGLVVITGCAHPGIVEILGEVKRLTGGEIYLVIGGFHLPGSGDSKLRDIIRGFRDLGVKKAAPCHCSGDRTRELFEEEYGEDFIANGVGKTIEI